jgi:hypothetical protein
MVRTSEEGGTLRRVVPALLFLLSAASAARAQEQRRFLEEERRREMDERDRENADLHQPFLWDAGGWLHLEFVNLEDPPDKTERTLRYLDLRLWGEARIEKRYTLYLRVQTDYQDFNSGDQFEGDDDNELRIAYVDQAYAEADWSSDTEEFVVRVGREFLVLGRGLLFNQVAYGLQASYASGRFGARAFGAHSIVHEDDIDRSWPGNDDSRRAFGGLELDYMVTAWHRAYAVAMIEKDLNDEDPEVAVQDWTYDANYVGLGARGVVAGDLGYSVEGIYQFGSSVAAGSTSEEDISSFALLATLEWRSEAELPLYFSLDYMYGSGDADRNSVTDAALGNAPGTDDEGFLAFGFVQTGFALFPRVSNLHIVRLGGSVRPLAGEDLFRAFEVGAYLYGYRKDEKSAPISDPRATEDDADIGLELDLFLRWRIASDVGVSVNFGSFMPGDAYLDDDTRNFFSAGLTYSF